jgi:3-hydroxybutyryl-CoA dehydrogenase
VTDQVAIVGAGLMGHGLAQVFATAGHPVTIHDPDETALASSTDRIESNLRSLGRDVAIARRVKPQRELAAAVADASFVIEATPEDLELKQRVFASIEAAAPQEAILATNTSVIPVGRIAAKLASPGRAIGTHWWNPPYLVPLVEVVQAESTRPEVVERTLTLLRSVGKCPVHVKRDLPGFVGNRLQHALWREAIALVANGVCDADTVDRVVTQGFGPRLAVMGPLENAELVGLDLTLAIHEHVLPDLDATRGPSPYLRELVEGGHLGMKSGRGMREWGSDDAERARDRLLRHLTAGDRETGQPA